MTHHKTSITLLFPFSFMYLSLSKECRCISTHITNDLLANLWKQYPNDDRSSCRRRCYPRDLHRNQWHRQWWRLVHKADQYHLSKSCDHHHRDSHMNACPNQEVYLRWRHAPKGQYPYIHHVPCLRSSPQSSTSHKQLVSSALCEHWQRLYEFCHNLGKNAAGLVWESMKPIILTHHTELIVTSRRNLVTQSLL